MPWQIEIRTMTAQNGRVDRDVWTPLLRRHLPYRFETEDAAQAFATKLTGQRAELRVVFMPDPETRLISV